MSPNTPCDTCAYGQSGAAKEPNNKLKAQICALGALPFYCHHAPDGQELNWHGNGIDYIRSMRDKKDWRVCAGWKRAVRANQRRGFFRKFGVIRRAIAQNALDSLATFLSHDEEPDEKELARNQLWRELRFLTKKDIEHAKVPLR